MPKEELRHSNPINAMTLFAFRDTEDNIMSAFSSNVQSPFLPSEEQMLMHRQISAPVKEQNNIRLLNVSKQNTQ